MYPLSPICAINRERTIFAQFLLRRTYLGIYVANNVAKMVMLDRIRERIL